MLTPISFYHQLGFFRWKKRPLLEQMIAREREKIPSITRPGVNPLKTHKLHSLQVAALNRRYGQRLKNTRLMAKRSWVQILPGAGLFSLLWTISISGASLIRSLKHSWFYLKIKMLSSAAWGLICTDWEKNFLCIKAWARKSPWSFPFE